MKRFGLMVAALAAAVSLTMGVTGALGATRSAGAASTVKTAKTSLGTILVDAKGRTLYLFEKDKRGHSACSAACAAYWPPLVVHGKPTAGPGVKRSLLSVTRRSDGKSQVVYAGHPLYRFALDTKAGQTKGQNLDNFGAEWYVVSPAGKKVEKH